MSAPLICLGGLEVRYSPGGPDHVPIGLVFDFTRAMPAGTIVIDAEGDSLMPGWFTEHDLNDIERLRDELTDYLARNGR